MDQEWDEPWVEGEADLNGPAFELYQHGGNNALYHVQQRTPGIYDVNLHNHNIMRRHWNYEPISREASPPLLAEVQRPQMIDFLNEPLDTPYAKFHSLSFFRPHYGLSRPRVGSPKR
jgi:hypothetical protein